MVHSVLLTRPMLQTPRWKLAELRCWTAFKRPESGEAMSSTWVTLTVHPLQRNSIYENSETLHARMAADRAALPYGSQQAQGLQGMISTLVTPNIPSLQQVRCFSLVRLSMES